MRYGVRLEPPVSTISGDRSVVTGRDVSGSTIITGDRNTVQTSKYNVNIGRAVGVAIGEQLASPTKSPTGITTAPVESSMVDSVGYDEARRLQKCWL